MFKAHVVTATTVALSLITLSQSALAQQASVRFHASDLTTPAGRRSITLRIHDAAARACYRGSGAPLPEAVASERCTRELSNVMIAKVNSLMTGPQLAAVEGAR